MTMLEHALDWARRGVPVVPCSPGGPNVKRPYIPRDKDANGNPIPNTGGVAKATTDPDQIRAWWDRWPSAMIGGAMGRELRLLAIDPDVVKEPGDADGLVAWTEIVAQHGGLPATHAHETPTGGRHYVFTMPEGLNLGNKEGALKGKGINVRGDGGYLIMAPSRLSDGRTYRMVDDFDFGRFAPAPQWLLDLLMQGKDTEPKEDAETSPWPHFGTGTAEANGFGAHARQSQQSDARFERYVASAVDKECAEVAACPKGGRNNRLNNAAFALGQFVGAGMLGSQEAERRLWEAAVGCGHVKDEGRAATMATIESGMTAGAKVPRDLSKVKDRGRISGAGSPDSEFRERPAETSAEETPKVSPLIWYGEKPPEPPPWLVRGIIPQAQVAIIAGVFSAGKTFVASDLAACLMLATPFAGREIVRPGAVLWLAAEGANEIDARIKAAAAARSADGEPAALPFARQAFDVPRLTAPDAEAQIMALVDAFKAGLAERFPGVELVMIAIDTVGSAAGFTDAAGMNEPQAVFKMLRSVNAKSGALVVVVDHFGKVAETGVMGSSTKAQSAEVILAILADKSVEGEIGNRRMAVHKQRSGAGGDVMPFKLRQVPLGGFDGTTCIVDWTGPAETGSIAPKTEKPNWGTVAERTLKGCLERVLGEHGSEQQPYGRKSAKVKAVHLKKVRDAFMSEYAVDVDDRVKALDAKRNAFKRARESAMRKGLVQTKEIGASLVDWIWFVTDDIVEADKRTNRMSTADADDPL